MRSRMALTAGTIAAGVLLGWAGTSAAHTTGYPSATSYGYAETPDQVFGQVSSPNEDCRRGRRVKLFMKRAGADPLRASTRTDAVGLWEFERNLAEGKKYYAVVLKKDIGPGAHRHICRAYETTALTFPTGAP